MIHAHVLAYCCCSAMVHAQLLTSAAADNEDEEARRQAGHGEVKSRYPTKQNGNRQICVRQCFLEDTVRNCNKTSLRNLYVPPRERLPIDCDIFQNPCLGKGVFLPWDQTRQGDFCASIV